MCFSYRRGEKCSTPARQRRVNGFGCGNARQISPSGLVYSFPKMIAATMLTAIHTNALQWEQAGVTHSGRISPASLESSGENRNPNRDHRMVVLFIGHLDIFVARVYQIR